MTPLDPFTLDRSALRAELAAYETLLGPPARELAERAEILPFFRANRNLASLVFQNNPLMGEPDLLKAELEFFGDHACDLAVGEAVSGQFVFVEFESAERGAVFKRGAKKGLPDYAARLEHGFSQVVDWFCLMDDLKKSNRFRGQFGTDLADYAALLIIGRDGHLDKSQQERLRWRSMCTQVGSRRVEILTYDGFLSLLRTRVELLAPSVPKVRKDKKS